ncbi:MAG: HIT family protein [Pyrinomonadaceae bacterium]
MSVGDSTCLFCKIVRGETSAELVYEDDISIAFLDHRPLFPGHTLLVPRKHFELLADLPATLVAPFFKNVQLLGTAVEAAMVAEGNFVAINNRVSQSVPHLHVHIVPRRRKDGLKGFFWPRTKYENQDQMEDVRARIKEEISNRR